MQKVYEYQPVNTNQDLNDVIEQINNFGKLGYHVTPGIVVCNSTPYLLMEREAIQMPQPIQPQEYKSVRPDLREVFKQRVPDIQLQVTE